MIRFIAALDNKMGIANDQGIPWQGRLPTDVAYFREKTLNSTVLMGYGWYVKRKHPLIGRRNLVAAPMTEKLKTGFEKITNAREFLVTTSEDIWVGGGNLFVSTLDLADELYLTRIDHDFHCTKFFPAYQNKFSRQYKSKTYYENGLSFRFEIWQRSQIT